MPTVLSHPAVPLSLRLACGAALFPPRLLAVGVLCSALPDLDVLGFRFGIPYSDPLGHRGFSHSILFALLLAAVAMVWSSWLDAERRWTFVFVFVSTVSHGVLDACTTGGLGVAFFSPFDNRRFFLPWQVIQVSPIGISRFLASRSGAVLASEIQYVWLPCLLIGLVGALIRNSRGGTPGEPLGGKS